MKQTAFILQRCCVTLMLLFPASGWGMIASIAPDGAAYQAETGRFQVALGLSMPLEYGNMAYTIQGKQDGGWKISEFNPV